MLFNSYSLNFVTFKVYEKRFAESNNKKQRKGHVFCLLFYWDGMRSKVITVFDVFFLSLACSGLQDVVISSKLIRTWLVFFRFTCLRESMYVMKTNLV